MYIHTKVYIHSYTVYLVIPMERLSLYPTWRERQQAMEETSYLTPQLVRGTQHSMPIQQLLRDRLHPNEQ